MKDKEEMKNKNWEDKENSNKSVKAVISSSRYLKNKEKNRKKDKKEIRIVGKRRLKKWEKENQWDKEQSKKRINKITNFRKSCYSSSELLGKFIARTYFIFFSCTGNYSSIGFYNGSSVVYYS